MSDIIYLFRKNTLEVLVSWLPYTNALPSWRLKSLALYAILSSGVGLAGLAAWRARSKDSTNPVLRNELKLPAVALLSALAYGGFLVISYLFSSITPDINDRMLSPLFPQLVIFICASAYLCLRAFSLPPLVQVIPVAFILLAGQYFYSQSANWAQSRDESTRGYAAGRWRNSELIAAVKELPENQPLVSNMPVPVLLYCNRFPYAIQELDQHQPVNAPTGYGVGEDIAQIAFRQQGAALIIFRDEFQQQMDEIYGKDSGARISSFLQGLYLAKETADGAIYYFAPPTGR